MIRFANKIFWKLLSSIILVLLIIAIWKYSQDKWSMDQVLEFLITSTYYGVPIIIFLIMIYRMYIEKAIYWWGRRKSAEVNADDIPMSVQVDGPKRSGKDSSQTGAAIILKELIFRRHKKELKDLRYMLYIYDFKLINPYLEKFGKLLFVASDLRINAVFEGMLKENNCFILDYWIQKGITPKTHLHSWKFRKNKMIPDVPFEDGLTPGGKHMLDMLKRYFLIYMRLHYTPNFIMSNQPIIEDYKISKKGHIKVLFSKIFSLDYLSLKKYTPMPFPISGIVIQTETAIYLPNTDSTIQAEINNTSGIRETYTTWGHLGREEVYVRDITQDKNRPNKSLRELYEGYIHVFKLKFVCTSNFFRFNYSIRRFLNKFKIFRLKIKRFIIPSGLKKVYQVRESTTKNKILKLGNKILKFIIKIVNTVLRFGDQRLETKIYRIRKRISLLHQKDLKKWAKGYIVFNLGVYDKIDDSGKKVRYPLFYGMKESSSKDSAYRMSGFKQVNKITDTFGRYDTFMMYTVREAKERIINMHFNDVSTWTKMAMSIEKMQSMKYSVLDKMLTVPLEYKEKILKEIEKKLTILRQKSKEIKIPVLESLNSNELEYLASDFKLDYKTLDYTFKFNKESLIKKISIYYNNNDLPDFDNLLLQELIYIADDLGIEHIDEDTIIEKWQDYLIDILIKEYKSFSIKAS